LSSIKSEVLLMLDI